MGKFKIYLKSILIPVIVGLVVGFIISRFIDYNDLIKPPFAPPSTLFPIIWTILYILMGISYGILESNNKVDTDIKQIYYAQLVVNAFWPLFFFVLKWRLFSFIWILLLSIMVLIMIIRFVKKNKVAGILQIPYLIWSIFATYLNLGVYILNK